MPTAPGRIPFAATWTTAREELATELRQTLLWWYRQTYQIPRHDPRLAGLTVEELEVEYLAWRAWHGFATLDPLQEARQTAYLTACAEGRLDPNDDAARDAFLAAWTPDAGVAPAEDEDDWEAVTVAPAE